MTGICQAQVLQAFLVLIRHLCEELFLKYVTDISESHLLVLYDTDQAFLLDEQFV